MNLIALDVDLNSLYFISWAICMKCPLHLCPEPPTSPYFEGFLNFSLNFRKTFDKILKNLQKNRKISLENFKKIKIFYWLFKHFLNIFEFEKTRNFWFFQWNK